MGRQGLVVFGFGQSLILDQLRLDTLLPLRLPKRLSLDDTRAAVLVRVRPRRREDLLIGRLVVRPCKLDVWSSICRVVGLEVWRDSLLELEIRLANAR